MGPQTTFQKELISAKRGVRPPQELLRPSRTAPKLVAAAVALAVLVIVGTTVFCLSTEKRWRITCGVVVVAAGVTTWFIFGHLDLLSGVPADFRAGLPECPDGIIRLADCVGVASRPGLILITLAGVMVAFFGTLGLLRVSSDAKGEGHRSDLWVLTVTLIAFGVATLLFVLWLVVQLSGMDTL